MLSEENVKFCFLVTFNVIISLIFPGNFIEIHQVSQKIFYFFDFNYFRHFLGFFYLYLLQKKLMMSTSIR